MRRTVVPMLILGWLVAAGARAGDRPEEPRYSAKEKGLVLGAVIGAGVTALTLAYNLDNPGFSRDQAVSASIGLIGGGAVAGLLIGARIDHQRGAAEVALRAERALAEGRARVAALGAATAAGSPAGQPVAALFR